MARAERDSLDVGERESLHKLVAVLAGFILGSEDEGANLLLVGAASANDIGIILAPEEERKYFCEWCCVHCLVI